MKLQGKKPYLTPEQADELRARYRLYQQNRPKMLERDYGIKPSALRNYIDDKIKNHWFRDR